MIERHEKQIESAVHQHYSIQIHFFNFNFSEYRSTKEFAL